MEISYSHDFNKKISKIPKKVVDKFFERLELFKINIHHPVLKNHKLHGEYAGFNSINITGNFRAIFKYITKNQVVFYDIGTVRCWKYHTNGGEAPWSSACTGGQGWSPYLYADH